jgi:hypothetical protein
MTASPNLIGIGAGIVAAVLFASLARNSALAILLFYLTPLPLMLAGIGWGTRAVLLALFTATIPLAILDSRLTAIVFCLFLALPCVVLCYLFLLHRRVPVQSGDQEDAAAGKTQIDWYPFGNIIAWAAVMAGVIAVFAFLQFGLDRKSYLENIRAKFDDATYQQLESITGPNFGRAEFQSMVDAIIAFVPYLPPAFAASWLLVIIGNLWLASKTASISGLLARPIPRFKTIEYPPFLLAGFCAALVLSFASGLVGFVGTAFLGAFGCAFLLLGLAVIHTVLAVSQLKILALTCVYAGLLLTPWIAPPLTILGLLEPFIQLRQRFAKQVKLPGTRPGPHS